MRSIFGIALLVFTLYRSGFSQFISTSPEIKFYENGKQTRIGADAAMFPDTPTRTKIDLSGQWQYSLDGQAWNSVSIPSAYDFTGQVIFQRTFMITSEMLDKYTFTLVCYGINYQSEITINGNFVGRHTGGYSSFIISIPRNTLQMGSENAIKIAVDNELTTKTTLPLKQQVGRWRTYGGIFRDIYLLATPKLFIERTDVTIHIAPDGKYAKVFVHGDITDRLSGLKSEAGSSLGFQVGAFDKLSGDLAGRSGITPLSPQINKTIFADAEILLPNPKLWSPDTPDLYFLRCQIVRIVGKEITPIDAYDIDIGMRNMEWKEGRLVLNNTPLMLKGILWQEDHPTLASAITYEALERDVASIKTLGANLIRFLYPPHPYMLNLCDRYGLLVMEEIPLVDVPLEILSKDFYQDMVTTYVKEMVERDRHHVSILAWGIGDEFETSSSSACDFVNGVRNIIKSVDKRNVYFSTRSMNNSCFDYVDLIALNSYGDDPKKFHATLQECKMKYAEKPIILARYGWDVEPGNHNGYSDPLSMEAQARYTMQFYNVIQDVKIAGSVLWSYNDWRTDRPSLSTHSHDPYISTMGVVSYDREKRTVFDVVRALFNDERAQALPVGNYSSNAPMIYVVAGLIVLISFAFFYNANRRFRDAVNRSFFRTYNFFADVRDQRILTYTQSIFIALVVSITWATVLSSIFTHYRNNHLLDNLLNQFMSDRLKESFVRLVWSPMHFILVISGLIFLKLILLTVFVKVCSVMVKTRVYFYHAISITMWSMLPYIILIPLSMILFRLMETEFYIIPLFVIIILISLWVILRLLKGISVIYDVYPIKVYAIGLLCIIFVSAAIYGYLDYTQSTTLYLKYLLRTINN